MEVLPAHMKEMWAMRDLQQLQCEKAMPAGLMHYTAMSSPQLEGVCVCMCVFLHFLRTEDQNPNSASKVRTFRGNDNRLMNRMCVCVFITML